MLNGSFRGSKCVAGIALLGRQALKSVLRLPESHGLSLEIASGILINRFRFAYVRQLSFGAHNVYVPAGRWKPLSAQHSITFAESVSRHFQQAYANSISEKLNERVRGELADQDGDISIALPPIGLFVLMKADPRFGARGVLDSALETFNDFGR